MQKSIILFLIVISSIAYGQTFKIICGNEDIYEFKSFEENDEPELISQFESTTIFHIDKPKKLIKQYTNSIVYTYHITGVEVNNHLIEIDAVDIHKTEYYIIIDLVKDTVSVILTIGEHVYMHHYPLLKVEKF